MTEVGRKRNVCFLGCFTAKRTLILARRSAVSDPMRTSSRALDALGKSWPAIWRHVSMSEDDRNCRASAAARSYGKWASASGARMHPIAHSPNHDE
jgi:hypothetical protein